MPLIVALFSGLGLWIFGELLAFGLVAQAIGLNWAIIATALSSLAGGLLLHRVGSTARQNLLAMMSERSGEPLWLAPERLRAGLFTSIGAVLLLLPGFLSDGVGLLLVARAARGHSPSGDRRRTKDGEVIELSPQDWHRIDETDRR